MRALTLSLAARVAVLAVLAALTAPPAALHGATQERRTPDGEAIRIIRRSLDAIEAGWALAAYDRAGRVRAAINVRGSGPPAVGVTANLVVERARRRLRLDTAGDVGPLTFVADSRQALLYVQTTGQYARRAAGALAPGAWLATDLTAEIAAIRARLDDGYPLLVYRGRDEIDGRVVEVVEDTPAPGTTATYWIDGTTFLPRRMVLAGPGPEVVRLDLAYGAGPRPSAAELSLEGPQSARVSITPGYDGSGRVGRLQAVVRPGGGGALAADLNFDWAADPGSGFFDFQPPPATAEVPFGQLASGVLLAAAGKLGALLQLLAGLA